MPLEPVALETLEYMRQNLLDASAVVRDIQLIVQSEVSRVCSPISNSLSDMMEDRACFGRPRAFISSDLVYLLQRAEYTWMEIL